METLFGIITIIAFSAIALISFWADYLHKQKVEALKHELIDELKEYNQAQDKIIIARAMASYQDDKTSFRCGDSQKINQGISRPPKTIFRENPNNLFICRKIKFGTNGNFVRYVPSGSPLSPELLKIIRDYYSKIDKKCL